MRKLKVRAYDKNEKRMISFQELRERSGILDFLDEYINPFSEMSDEYKKDRIYMQYIGMNDVDDKEICEGDIIDIGMPLDQTNRNFIGEVYYCNEFACFRVRHPNIILISEYDKPKILGNIYENPELLNKE